jgi:hypothetical protein
MVGDSTRNRHRRNSQKAFPFTESTHRLHMRFMSWNENLNQATGSQRPPCSLSSMAPSFGAGSRDGSPASPPSAGDPTPPGAFSLPHRQRLLDTDSQSADARLVATSPSFTPPPELGRRIVTRQGGPCTPSFCASDISLCTATVSSWRWRCWRLVVPSIVFYVRRAARLRYRAGRRGERRGFVGARLYWLLEHWSDASQNLTSSVFTSAGFTWYGGFIGGFVAVAAWSRARRIPWVHRERSGAPAPRIRSGPDRVPAGR